MDGKDIRHTLLKVVNEHRNDWGFQQRTVLIEAANRMNLDRTDESEQALLTIWYDLFRNGDLSWGYNLSNPDPPFCHLTEKGRTFLKTFSRDPGNPDGYIENLTKNFKINDIALSYIKEAITTYNNSCYKATAVMIGCASENIILELRDILVAKMIASGENISPKLESEKIKTVIDGITAVIDSKYNSKKIPYPLYEKFNSYWSALSGQIRISRNEAGHPKSVEPASEDSVLASLLIFPEILKLVEELSNWINNNYS